MKPGDDNQKKKNKNKRRTEIEIKHKVRLVKRFKEQYGHIETLSKSIDIFLNGLREELGPDSCPSSHAFRKWIKKVDSEEWTENMSQRRKKEIRSILNEADTRSITEAEYTQGLQVFDLFPITTRLDLLPAIKIERCQPSDLDEYYNHIWSQPAVMKLFADGVRTREHVAGRVKTWCQRWEDGNPFAGFTVRLPDENNTFLGVMVLDGPCEEENSAEISGMLRQEYHSRGFATAAMIHLLAHARKLFQDGVEFEDGKPFERIIATCHPDNEPSRRLLDYQRFRRYTPSNPWRSDRLYYDFEFSSLERGCTGIP